MHQAFGEDPGPQRWEEFQRLYWNELKDKHRSLKLLRKKIAEGILTLVHAAHDSTHNAALVLKRFLEEPEGSAAES